MNADKGSSPVPGLSPVAVPADLAARLLRIVPPAAEYSFAAIVDGPSSLLIEAEGTRFLSAASLAKLFIAAGALRRMGEGELSADSVVPINVSNRVGDPNGLDPGRRDTVPLGMSSATVGFLIRQMLNLSSNTAANVLVDLLGRERINADPVARFGWAGSEVTRKFVPRDLEPAEYRAAPPTMCCPRHVAELLWRASRGRLAGEPHDQILAAHLWKGLRHSQLSLDDAPLPGTRYSRKIGSLQGRDRHGRLIRWQHEAGVLRGGSVSVILCVMSCFRPPTESDYFPLAAVQRAILAELSKAYPPGDERPISS